MDLHPKATVLVLLAGSVPKNCQVMGKTYSDSTFVLQTSCVPSRCFGQGFPKTHHPSQHAFLLATVAGETRAHSDI